MVGGVLERGGKEGYDRRLKRNQPTIFFSFKFPGPTPPKTLFLASVCVCMFLGLGPGWGKKGAALQYKAGSVGG